MTTTTATDISSTNTQSNQKGEGIVSLTVGKVDASIALLTTDDHLIIEFPTILLPEDIKTGSIVQFNVSHNYESESNVFTKFLNLQNDIFQKYGQLEPSPPHLSKLNVTQTSCILKWDNLNLGSVDLKSLILYKSTIKPENANSGSSIPDNAQSSTGAATHTKMERITMIPNPIKTNSFKISGLSVDTSYEFQLKMSTTSGTYYSNRLAIKTHKMTDMSGITCCLGKLDTTLQITENDIKSCLDSIGAKPLQNKVTIDTTHYITNEVDEVDNDQDEELEKAKRNNIPIVKPEWVRACQVEKRIIGVRGFYYQNPVGGADDMTGNYKFDKSLTEAYLSKISAEEKTETGKDQEAVTEVQKENKMEEEEENNIEKEDKASSGNSEQEGGLEDKDFKTEDLNEELTTDNEQSKEQKEDVLKNDKKIKAVDLNDQQEDEDEEGKYENIIEQAGKEEKSMEEPMVEEGKEGEPVEETKDEGPVGGNNEESVGGNNEEPIEENKGEEEELMGENKENPVEGNREEPVKEEPVKKNQWKKNQWKKNQWKRNQWKKNQWKKNQWKKNQWKKNQWKKNQWKKNQWKKNS
ncbi:Chs5p SCDLUD_001439 [Saccharomycodes ludwigii]|uniref:Chs5p n=1 Tax=Saccharomycodes ludwigii TaxID=36035 RepID=UPI001E8319B7|nr:hypothetical protein SCDLUD_001439 [Saccharomycodes ludwigii]KAH3901669.1 hypothetical protein SCDLUD_001439 [Saccharomycodes ludwigii]